MSDVVGSAASKSAQQAMMAAPAMDPRWAYLVGKLRRIRARQRYWGFLGQLLQEYPASLRDRLRLAWPSIGSARHRLPATSLPNHSPM